MEKTTKYVLLMVEVEHEPNADLEAICEALEVYCDEQDGSVTKSEVLDVSDKPRAEQLRSALQKLGGLPEVYTSGRASQIVNEALEV